VSHIAAVTTWEPPFQNLEGLLQSQYSLAVVNGSDIHSELEVRNTFAEHKIYVPENSILAETV
jgi:hypothetical protein